MLRQAELSSEASVATHLWGRVHQAGELPDSHPAWACEVALRTSEPQKVIDPMEGRLRQDPPLQLALQWRALLGKNAPNLSPIPIDGPFRLKVSPLFAVGGRGADKLRYGSDDELEFAVALDRDLGRHARFPILLLLFSQFNAVQDQRSVVCIIGSYDDRPVVFAKDFDAFFGSETMVTEERQQLFVLRKQGEE